MNRSLAGLGSPALPAVTVFKASIVISPHGDGDLLLRNMIPQLGIVYMHNIVQGVSHPSELSYAQYLLPNKEIHITCMFNAG